VTHEYGSLAELKRARKIPPADTTDDAALMRALERASRAIDDRCGVAGTGFWLEGSPSVRLFRTRGRVVPGDGDGEILLADAIGSTSGLTVSEGDYQDALTPLTDFTYEPLNAIATGSPVTGLLRTRSVWSKAYVAVTAAWGWPVIPPPIAEACVLLANRRFVRLSSPEGVAGWGGEGVIRVSRFDPDIEDLVSPYVQPGFA
jgi:hypothetical protein